MTTLGAWYRDTALGLAGTAVARTEHLGGSPVVTLQWVDDGVVREMNVEEARLAPLPTSVPGFHA